MIDKETPDPIYTGKILIQVKVKAKNLNHAKSRFQSHLINLKDHPFLEYEVLVPIELRELYENK